MGRPLGKVGLCLELKSGPARIDGGECSADSGRNERSKAMDGDDQWGPL